MTTAFKPKRKMSGSHHLSNFRKRGLSLPTKLAEELAALGHTIKTPSNRTFSKSKPDIKSRGKINAQGRNEVSRHNTNTKRKNDLSSERPHSKNVSSNLTQSSKKQKLNPSQDLSSQIVSASNRKQTALEKLCNNQTGSQTSESNVNSKKRKRKTKEEELEDKQIAWLETQLGIKNDQRSQAKLRQEFQADGLEDLFDGLDELDQLVDNLKTETENDPTQASDHGVEDIDLNEDTLESEDDIDRGSEPDSAASWAGCSIDDEISHKNTNTQEPNNEKSPIESVSQSNIAPQPPKSSTSYVPPHLRQLPQSKTNETPDAVFSANVPPPLDPRLRRQLMGILNRVSPTSMPTCLDGLRQLYLTHPRAIITNALDDLILGLISTKDALGAALSVTYAALVAAISRGGIEVSGVEIGWAATFVAELAIRICKIYQRFESNERSLDDVGKAGVNLLVFLSNLYTFQVISCRLVYDFVRLLIESGLGEIEVEGLMVLLKSSGPRLRHDDPAALKDIVGLVQSQKKDMGEISSRTKFMFETLMDLKNNKIRKEAQAINNPLEELQENLKKYLGGLAKKSSSSTEPLRFTLADIQTAGKKGKWWLIGAAWEGNTLEEEDPDKAHNKPLISRERNQTELVMLNMAKKQGMNTDVRRSIFSSLMTGEDYVDACDKINQLGLTGVQQREVVKVLLHCLGSESVYNPYYTMVGQKLATDSHSMKITMQFTLWDFFRELGETQVGGEEMLKNLGENFDDQTYGVNKKRMDHLAKAYGWWIAKGSLSINILKPLPFGSLKLKTIEFVSELMTNIFLSIQSISPILTRSKIIFKKDSKSIQRVFSKTNISTKLIKELMIFLESKSLNLKSNLKNSFEQKHQVDQYCQSLESYTEFIDWCQQTTIEILSSFI